jgi:peroxiredoxin
VAQLRREQNRFKRDGAGVVLVGMGSPQECEQFRREQQVPFPIISDPDRRLYKAFQLQRMSALGMLSPALAVKGISAMARGHGLGRPVGDVRQLPGVFIVDSDGRIAWGHRPEDPAGHPAPATILAALADITAPRKT